MLVGRNVEKCKYCAYNRSELKLYLVGMKRLTYAIQLNYSIKDNFYGMKSINDILFNNQLSVEDEQVRGAQNLQKSMGKMLTAVFKDYLIQDDVYEFLDKFNHLSSSKEAIVAHCENQHSIAVQKYGYKAMPLENCPRVKRHYSFDEHENIVNSPSHALLCLALRKMLYNNKRMKYLMKYEKRVQQKEH